MADEEKVEKEDEEAPKVVPVGIDVDDMEVTQEVK